MFTQLLLLPTNYLPFPTLMVMLTQIMKFKDNNNEFRGSISDPLKAE